MTIEGLGKLYGDGEVIIRQGDGSDSCMFVIQKGSVEVVRVYGGSESRVATLGQGETFGEMAIFDREVRSATVRALGEARILTVDKRTFLRRAQEDPTLAFSILKSLSQRIRRLNSELAELRSRLEALGSKDGAARPGREHGDAGPPAPPGSSTP